ncbi:MAG: hypothetical protein IJ728_03225 [Selenomonadaceae bacterium]|nr:hypothetical protein [Selenomonadaceae bacterium]
MEISKNRLDLYLRAEEAILNGAQSYTIGNRSLTRANLSEIRKMIDDLQEEIESLEGKPKGYTRRIVLID